MYLLPWYVALIMLWYMAYVHYGYKLMVIYDYFDCSFNLYCAQSVSGKWLVSGLVCTLINYFRQVGFRF